jgi:hypothetical protein
VGNDGWGGKRMTTVISFLDTLIFVLSICGAYYFGYRSGRRAEREEHNGK